MLRFLFPRLTQAQSRGAKLFAALSAEARKSHWYADGGAPDTVDGRFAVLATVTALVVVRLERGGDAGKSASVALVERFVEAMDAEHRQMGMGDPAVGQTVRKLVGSLSRRVDLWRGAVDDEGAWATTTAASLFRGETPIEPAIAHCARELRNFWLRLEAGDDAQLADGRIG